MFRKGGMASGGITSGLQAPRQGYATNQNNLVQKRLFGGVKSVSY